MRLLEMMASDYGVIRPQSIRLYVSSRGWEKQRSESKYDIYENKAFDEVLVIPNDQSLRDYSKRVGELIGDLSRLYGERSDVILSGVTLSSATDIIEYHYEPQDGEFGLIPVLVLQDILSVGRDINRIALRDMSGFRQYYASGNWGKNDVLDDVRIGPTVPGSYGVQFIYPGLGSGKWHQKTIDDRIAMDRPILRSICDKIEDSMREIVDAAERGRTDIDPDLRISYNFVSSMMGLEFDNADVRIQRTKTINSEVQSKPIELSKPVFRNIAKIEYNMRPQSLSKQRTVVGRLVQLNDTREEIDDGPISMKIKYMDPDKDKVLTASFKIDGEDANIAYDASKKRSFVSITGMLIDGQRKRIEDITEFKVLRGRIPIIP